MQCSGCCCCCCCCPHCCCFPRWIVCLLLLVVVGDYGVYYVLQCTKNTLFLILFPCFYLAFFVASMKEKIFRHCLKSTQAETLHPAMIPCWESVTRSILMWPSWIGIDTHTVLQFVHSLTIQKTRTGVQGTEGPPWSVVLFCVGHTSLVLCLWRGAEVPIKGRGDKAESSKLRKYLFCEIRNDGYL